jgi:hypothetical protein
MTRTPGGQGRQPGKPYKDRDAGRRRSILGGPGAAGGSGVRPGGSSGAGAFDDDFEDDEFTSTSDRNDSLAARQSAPRPGVRPPAGQSPKANKRPVAKAQPQKEQPMMVKLATIDPMKRGVAFMIDIIVAFILSLLISAIVSLLSKLIPPLGMIVTQQGLVIGFLLIKDYFYQGRGIGKNLMGLQVVDVYTGLPPTILQSSKRNVLFFVPLILTWIMQVVLRFLPLPGGIDSFILRASELISMIYVMAVVPAECWLAYNREDSRRFGDRFAHTGVIEADMNFSKPF